MPETHAPPARDDDAAAPIGRRLLGAGLGGLAASLLPQLMGRARATTPDDTSGVTTPDAGSTPPEGEGTGETSPTDVTVVPEGPTPDETEASTSSTVPATTTTASPRRPTEADIELLGFARSVEMMVVHLYDTMLAGGLLDDTARSVVETIREAHQGYGQGVGALLGQAAPDDVEVELGITVGSSQESVLMALYDAEAVALATHIDLIGRLEATDGGRLIASVATMEARHCTVLADLAGAPDLDTLLLTNVEPLQAAG